MFRFFATIVSVSCVGAFMLSSVTRSSPSAKIQMNSLPGSSAPMGYFDPLGLSQGKSDEQIALWRESELKHGRLAMLAAVGILVGEAVEFSTPLYGDKIVGLAIYQFQEADQLTGFAFGFGILALISIIEFYGINRGWESVKDKGIRDPKGITKSQLKPGYISGDLNFDPLGLAPKDAEAFEAMQTKELNNGRLAMIAAAGMILQEIASGKGILENLGLESALPKAFDTATF